MARGSLGIEGKVREQGQKEAEVKKNVMSLLAVVLICFLAVIITGKALAAGTWSYYNLTVPPFGGTANTNNLQKLYTGQCAVNSTSVGANYDLWAYLELVDNTVVSTKQLINDGTSISFDNWASAGQTVHMTFQSGQTDPVYIQAIGYWSPDNP
ncbi:hypothetical protein SMC6_02995 [Candidatus Cryosericum odellii]|uniref:Uncharacterized protein n=2 Tax=Candidatus Cryosericum odellii TaxID=2290917 RepID=A0A398DAB1_9BACT|nr:hypothetical protein SMC6_02995 [Candidatus Cryosericum odellii]